MKLLINKELTNHLVFNLYDEVIEPNIADASELEGIFFHAELYDVEELVNDPGNEYLIFLKIVLGEPHTDDDYDAWLKYMNKGYLHNDLVVNMVEGVEEFGYNTGDYFHSFHDPIRMNDSIIIPLSIQK